MIQFVLGIISLLAGAALAMQSAVNGALRTTTRSPLFASIASFSGGLLLLPWMLILSHIAGFYEVPTLELLKEETEWWMYVGGILGVILVLGSVLITKKIGFTPYFSLLIAGQLVGSVLADSVGFLGGEVIVPDLRRISGIIILVMGAILAQK